MNWRYMLADLTDSQVDEIVHKYKDFADIEMTNQELARCCQGDEYYSAELLYKCFFWYIHNKKVPGFNGRVKI